MANADGTSAVQLTNNTVEESGARISPDNSQVLFTSDSNGQFETYYNNRLFVAPASGGAARVLVGEKDSYAVDSARWSKDGKFIFMLVNLGVHEELFVLPASGGTPTQAHRWHAQHQRGVRGGRTRLPSSSATRRAQRFGR